MMLVETNLSEHVKSFGFISNHFYVRIVDDHNTEQKFIAGAMVKCVCEHCKKVFLVESVLGHMVCPHCNECEIVISWVKPQIVFVPESEADLKICYKQSNKGEDDAKQTE